MSTGTQLAAQVVSIVKDASVTTSVALEKLNEALQWIAGELPLKALEAVDTVDTSDDNEVTTVTLPANFGHSLFDADVDESPVDIYRNYTALYRALRSATGDVTGVAVDGSNLRYLPAQSSATTITLFYYRLPAAFTVDGTPEGFSSHARVTGETVMVHYAAWKLWDVIEDGADGDKTNAKHHERLCRNALLELTRLENRGCQTPLPKRNTVHE